MITVTSAQLLSWLALFIFPFVRILAMIASAPILGNKQVPVRIKIGLSILLTIVIAPTLTIQPNVDPASALGFLILLQQLLAGLAIGFTMRLIFTAIEMAGDIIGIQMGLGFAIFFDPQNSSYTPVIAQFLGILAALVFLNLNGHLFMLEALADSFHTFPINSAIPAAIALHTLASWGGSIFSNALQLSMPVIGALLITNFALGILTRSAPQLNIFAVGFPVTLTIGFATVMLLLPYLVPLLENITHTSLGTVLRVMQQFGKS
ncbi:MAG: flagellar biosynthetic protein FliR [Candidatus Nitrotoga sp.]|nr:flagellar biosynthetic protein FliR [Candidatus Nitrotoga sp.]MDP1855588.1 flagellar biosynthetic protein FliR [Candidatus Nitrotoga sp.]